MENKFSFNNKINRRVFIYIFLCSLLLSVCSIFLQLYVDFKDSVSRLEERLNNIELSFTQSISTSLWDFNIELVKQQIEGIQRLPDIRYVKVTTSLGKEYTVGEPIENPEKVEVYQFHFEGENIGEMQIFADHQDIYRHLWQKASFIGVSEFIKIFIVALCTFFIVHLLISRHLYNITLYSKKISGENLDNPLALDSRQGQQDELDELVEALNKMRITLKNEIEKLKNAENALLDLNSDLEMKVKESTAKLADSNSQLQDSLQELTLAKDQLVQSEKMASLGQLVAGVAHEVNTPLGICVTSISALKENMLDLDKALKSGKLTKKHLVSCLNLFWEYDRIIDKSLDKAVELIRGFKSVAVDQHVDTELEVNLSRHVHDIVNAVSTLFKSKEYDIQVIIDPDLIINTYPSAWNQILTNLLTNSHIHGFEDRMQGKISLEFKINGNSLELLYQDDGKGLDDSIKSKIFDPFVTTKRGTGGSGLGMNIVYNLIHSKLNGTITIIDSEQGCCFLVKVPLYNDEAL